MRIYLQINEPFSFPFYKKDIKFFGKGKTTEQNISNLTISFNQAIELMQETFKLKLTIKYKRNKIKSYLIFISNCKRM